MIIGVGTDIVDVARIEKLIEVGGTAFLERWFTPGERAACAQRWRPAAHFAARLAAKEAVAKSLRWEWTGPLHWRDIEVVTLPSGAPGVRLAGQMRVLAAARAVGVVHVSLSHSQCHATAIAIASTVVV